MGLTLCHRGMLDDPGRAACLINELCEIAEICVLESSCLDKEWSLSPQATVVVSPSTLRSAEQVLRLVEDTFHRKGLHGW